MDSPGKTLAGGASTATARALPGQLAQTPAGLPPSSLRVLMPSTTLEPKLGRRLHGGMRIFVKTRSIQNQMRIRRRRSLARSLPRIPTRPPARPLPGMTKLLRQGPCRAPGKTLAENIHRAGAGPVSAKTPPPFPCSCQPNQLGRHLRGNMQLPGQLSRRLRGGMQIFVKAPPPRHLSCLPAYMAPHALLARARVEARRSGDGRDGPRPRPR